MRAIDECLASIVPVVTERGGAVVITADHGNAEMMWDDANDQPHTAHTLNPVPVVLCCDDLVGAKVRPMGILADVAPTLADWFRLDEGPDGPRSLLAVTDTYVEREFPPRAVVVGDGAGRASLRTDDWRLIVGRGGEATLYRVERMQELEIDVAPEHPDVVAALREELVEFFAAAPDEWAVRGRREAVTPDDLPPNVLESLKSLGYIE